MHIWALTLAPITHHHLSRAHLQLQMSLPLIMAAMLILATQRHVKQCTQGQGASATARQMEGH